MPLTNNNSPSKNVLNIASCKLSACKPKKLDLVHQTAFPCERVGSGTNYVHMDVVSIILLQVFEYLRCMW